MAHRLCRLLVLVTLTAAASLAITAAAADQVTVSSGVLEGTVAENHPVRLFAGVPFAAPPLGELRFKAPQPVPPWEGVRTATEWGNRCMQGPVFGEMVSRDKQMAEDCLYLNVWTPASSPEDKLPVYLWYYGGGFVTGSASEQRYDGAFLAKQGIVVVEPNYRLGAFGFLAHPELTEESGIGASGNYGLLDQVAALEWVKENIAAFGGNPDDITIGGESAGSLSVSVLMASPLSRDKVTKAVGESGAYFPSPSGSMTMKSLAEVEQAGAKFASSLGATSIAELRAKPADEILAAVMKANPFLFGPNIDGHVVPESIPEIFAKGEQAHIPLLAGWNSSEIGMAVAYNPNKPTPETFPNTLREQFKEHAEAAAKVYPATTKEETLQTAADLASDQFIVYSTWKWLEEQARTAKTPVYRYQFDRVMPDPKGMPSFGAAHASELPYAFNSLDLQDAPWQPEDYATATAMATYWANFIKTGDPSSAGLTPWPEFSKSHMVLHLDAECTLVPEQHRDRYEFLDSLVGSTPAPATTPTVQQDSLQSAADLLAGTPIAVAYSGFREGQHPDRGDGAVNPSDAQILEDLQILAKDGNFPLLRVYDCNENSEAVLRIIKENNLDIKVLLGIWLDAEISNHEGCPWLDEPIPPEKLAENKVKNEQQLEKGIRLAATYADIVVAVNVGNETQMQFTDHMLSIDSLISYVKKVKSKVSQPITVVDFDMWWLEHGEQLAPELDFIGVNTYAAWMGIPIDDAVAFSDGRVRTIKDRFGGAQIVVTETGWATIATEFPDRASEENERQYFNEVTSWAKKNNVTTFLFEAFDEPWKGDPGNPDGAEKHWGLFTVDRQAKLAMYELYPERVPSQE